MTTPVDYVIYGKIIIDTVKLASGEIRQGLLGGGGPQALFGASLWHDSVGFLSRAGTDIESRYLQTITDLGIDRSGLTLYPDLKTVYGGLVVYNESEYDIRVEERMTTFVGNENWHEMLRRTLDLPDHFQRPKAIHLITEFFDEAMVASALALRAQGAIFSLEPLVDIRFWKNQESLLALLPQVDIVTPDWPTASKFAGSNDPATVLDYWCQLGAGLVAIRNGRHGSYVWDQQSAQRWHIPVVPLTPVDPTGAGNCYGAGLCVGWGETGEARLAGAYGTVSASFMVETAGMPIEINDSLRETAEKRLQALLERITPL